MVTETLQSYLEEQVDTLVDDFVNPDRLNESPKIRTSIRNYAIFLARESIHDGDSDPDWEEIQTAMIHFCAGYESCLGIILPGQTEPF